MFERSYTLSNGSYVFVLFVVEDINDVCNVRRNLQMSDVKQEVTESPFPLKFRDYYVTTPNPLEV